MSRNFTALAFSKYWVLYRRIRSLTWFFIANFIVDIFLIMAISNNDYSELSLLYVTKNIFLSFYTGLRGNYHYRNDVQVKMEKIKQKAISEAEKLSLYKKRGGTNLVAALVFFPVATILVMGLIYLLAFVVIIGILFNEIP